MKKKYISKCCLCGKTRRKPEDSTTHNKHLDEWDFHDLERYYEDYDLIHSHGYCDECFKKTLEEAQRWLEESSWTK